MRDDEASRVERGAIDQAGEVGGKLIVTQAVREALSPFPQSVVISVVTCVGDECRPLASANAMPRR
jgi:hypothetical protein